MRLCIIFTSKSQCFVDEYGFFFGSIIRSVDEELTIGSNVFFLYEHCCCCLC